jgi:Xaa-Pro aminopeptidase
MQVPNRFSINKETFGKRREKLTKCITNGIAIIPSGSLKQRSNDTEYSFRQNSNFYYLSGFKEPNSVLVIINKNGEQSKTRLYLSKKDPQMELWTGIRLGKDFAPKVLGVDEAKDIEDFEGDLEELILGSKNLYLSAFHDNSITKKIYKVTNELWTRRRKTTYVPTQVTHIDHFIEQMRLIKEEEEIKDIKKAASITTLAHKACMSKAAPGINERDIEGCLHYFFRKNGGSGEAYGSIVASGNNANILHYIENDTELKNGDLILIDAGAEKNLYACDVTRTFPVNGKFTNEQKEIYQIVLNSQLKTISEARPGKTLGDLHETASKELIKGLIQVGILSGSVEENFQNEGHRKFYPHGTGHWLGMDVHDQCPYTNDKNGTITLKPNMYFTVEPGLYFDKENMSVPEKYRGIGIRIEDDILITQNGHEVLTKDIPKTVEEIESACQKDYKSFF